MVDESTSRRAVEPDWGHVAVQGLLYLVTPEGVCAVVLDGPEQASFVLGPPSLLLRLDELREELRDPMALARGRVPQLSEFTQGWGRRLVPAPLLADPPDVLVVVPHSLLHDLPLHLVLCDDGEPLGVHSGITYSSSASMFPRSASRNPARMPGTAGARSVFAAGSDLVSVGPDRFAELAQGLARGFGDEPVPGGVAPVSRSELKFRLRNAGYRDLVCLVVHGYLAPDDHRLSGLVLAGGNHLVRSFGAMQTNADDARANPSAWIVDVPLRMLPAPTRDQPAEVLTLQEMEAEEDLETELVILAGCSAGLGDLLVGDRSASIAEICLDLGAPSVLAPMWDVDLATADRWLDTFLEAWAQDGQPKAFAARTAMRALRHDGLGPERTGAFALRGDWL